MKILIRFKEAIMKKMFAKMIRNCLKPIFIIVRLSFTQVKITKVNKVLQHKEVMDANRERSKFISTTLRIPKKVK